MLFLETTAVGQMFVSDGLINSVDLNCKEGENRESRDQREDDQ